MKQKYHNTILIIFMLIALAACDKKEIIIEPGTSIEPEEFFPCWGQTWKCGEWLPLERNLEDYPEDTLSLKRTFDSNFRVVDEFFVSVCDLTNDMRLIDPKEKTYRIIKGLPHKNHVWRRYSWIAGEMFDCRDPISEDDILIVVCESNMYAVWITRVFDSWKYDDYDVSYKIAQFNMTEENCSALDLGSLKWSTFKRQEDIYFGNRYLLVYVNHLKHPVTDEYILSFQYDRCYGNKTIKGVYPPDTPLAHIAIIHKDDYEYDEPIDLRHFRFKTWEDGLGNKR